MLSIPPGLKPPTTLRALGYLRNCNGERVSLGDYVATSTCKSLGAVPVLVVAGSSMDSGKTTTAASIINGLTRAGHRVAAAKVTGTASINDILLMRDAGAAKTLDFTSAGFGSTAGLTQNQLVEVFECLLSQLMSVDPDTVVVELADGILQPETAALLDFFAEARLARALVYACTDALGVRRGIEQLRRRGLRVAAVSGTLTSSPLGIAEAQKEIEIPILRRDELRDPAVVTILLEHGDMTPQAHVAR